MKLYELFHENSKEYIAEKELTKNSLHQFDPIDNFYCRSIDDAPRFELPEGDAGDTTELIRHRDSDRDFTGGPIALSDLATVLRNAYSVRPDSDGFRVVPSAGASYPLEVYVAAFNTSDLDAGIYHYNLYDESLEKVRSGEFRSEIKTYSHDQDYAEDASLLVLLTATFERTTYKYGERGYRYVFIEAGHVGQNVYLTCEELGLGVCASGGFADEEVASLFDLPDDEHPVYSLFLGTVDE